jgi:hypothetical protein
MNSICDTLHQLFGEMKQYSFPFNKHEIPVNGIYILFEKGEFAHSTNSVI